MTVAALFVDRRGAYANLEGVDLWDETRDARLYAGPWPVVAHPPCSRWCRLAGLVQARYPHLRKGEDDGVFASALASVRRWGGVLEHPAYSDAWAAFGLPVPDRRGGWQRGLCGGWACYVEQVAYGHVARKATWLYAFGTDGPPAPMRSQSNWRLSATHVVSWCKNHGLEQDTRPRVGKKAAAATPPEFRDALLDLARSCAGSVALTLLALARSKPDVDNIAKGILDSLNGIAWHDDAQVVLLRVSKEWADSGGARTVVSIMPQVAAPTKALPGCGHNSLAFRRWNPTGEWLCSYCYVRRERGELKETL